MMALNYLEAYNFYVEHINRTALFRLLESRNLKVTGSVPSIVWELFGSILTGKKGAGGYGADLDGVEIKSAAEGSSFEYQYHLNTGLSKLEEDQKVDHFFCSYCPDYHSFKVYFVKGNDLATYFQKWIPEYLKNYRKSEESEVTEEGQRRQRFRRSISNGHVVQKGILVMEVRGGKLVTPWLKGAR